MTVLDQVPPPRPMRAVHDAALLREMRAIVAAPSRRWRFRRPGLAIGISVGIAVAGGAAAAAYARFAPVNDKTTAHCYSLPNLSGDNGTAVAAVGPPGSAALVTNALATCQVLWRDGFLAPGSAEIVHVTGTTTVHPVPNLVVCTMPNGTAGVFPGKSSLCARLGLSMPPAAGNP